jgi:hypothetical protein
LGVTVWWNIQTDSQDKIEAITRKWEEKYKPELDLAHIKHGYKRIRETCTFALSRMQTPLEFSGVKTYADLEAKISSEEIKILTKMPNVQEFIDMVEPKPKFYVIEPILGQDWREFLRRREDIGKVSAIWVYSSVYFGLPAWERAVEGIDYVRVPSKGFVDTPDTTESIVMCFAEIRPDKFFCHQFCKTQPFTNEQVEPNSFIHMLLCEFLSDIEKEGYAKVHVKDEADYYTTRDVDVLLKNFSAGYEVIERVGKAIEKAGWKREKSE